MRHRSSWYNWLIILTLQIEQVFLFLSWPTKWIYLLPKVCSSHSVLVSARLIHFSNGTIVYVRADIVEIEANLHLADVVPPDRPWRIVATNALTGEGIDDGMIWLEKQLKALMSKKGKRSKIKAVDPSSSVAVAQSSADV